DAEEAGIAQGIAEHGLQGRADDREPAAHHRGPEDARETDRPEDGFSRRRQARRHVDSRGACQRGEQAAKGQVHAARAGGGEEGEGQRRGQRRDDRCPPRLHGFGPGTRSGWSARARYQLASAACWLRVTSSSVGIWTTWPSRTARSLE